MEILSVKLQASGWLLNGTMSVPNASGNTERELIVEWLKTNTPEPEFTTTEFLANTKTVKLQELETAFNTASKLPVTVGTKTYNGGEDSVIAIKNYIEYGIKKGLTEYHIWDIDNDKIAYTLAQAQAIELAIANTVVANNFKLNDKKVAVKVATTITAVSAVTY